MKINLNFIKNNDLYDFNGVMIEIEDNTDI